MPSGLVLAVFRTRIRVSDQHIIEKKFSPSPFSLSLMVDLSHDEIENLHLFLSLILPEHL